LAFAYFGKFIYSPLLPYLHSIADCLYKPLHKGVVTQVFKKKFQVTVTG